MRVTAGERRGLWGWKRLHGRHERGREPQSRQGASFGAAPPFEESIFFFWVHMVPRLRGPVSSWADHPLLKNGGSGSCIRSPLPAPPLSVPQQAGGQEAVPPHKSSRTDSGKQERKASFSLLSDVKKRQTGWFSIDY